MIYKIGNIKDLEDIPSMDETAKAILYHHAKVLEEQYGENRDLDLSDGGYVLYASPNTTSEELLDCFDYHRNIPESVERYKDICVATYVTNNDYCVVIVMSLDSIPAEIANEIEDIL